MIKAEIKDCNNIKIANIHLNKNKLNICYSMNGTGKSTIARTIDHTSKGENLIFLKPFDSDHNPSCTLSENLNTVLLFDEDFVNNIVFKESEVIQNAFDVFIKTPEYEEKQKLINERLKKIHIDTNENKDLEKLLRIGQSVLLKLSLTKSGDFKQVGIYKSLTSTESIFELPKQIKKFQPLMDKDYKVDWVGWKNDGAKYDDNKICPFCTNSLDNEYEKEKALFSSSYSKSNVRNIIEMISYFDEVKDYMDEVKSEKLYQCVKDGKDVSSIHQWLRLFYDDLSFLVEKIGKVFSFNSFNIKSEDISRLDEELKRLKIDASILAIINNNKVIDIINFINNGIDLVLKEINDLKSEIGQLKGLIGSASRNAVEDINEFLLMSDINYRVEIQLESEDNTKTILRYLSKDAGLIQVDKINLHLSWGERNAFALILFMHFALSQNPDLIILDDPISSFDSNKKFAIINRLFLNQKKKRTFYRRTVLMLTHELQPVIDFVINNKPNGEFFSACFLRNKTGIIDEVEITDKDIKSLLIILDENARNPDLNKVHRITSLRKLLEHLHKDHAQDIAYNLLSCLLHCKDKPVYLNENEILPADIIIGEGLIRTYVTDFSYVSYKNDIFNKTNLVSLFESETNSYFRLQVFRVLLALTDLRSKLSDDPLLKYIDEQFHIENDYIFSLDFNKYDIVPDFVIPKCFEFLRAEGILK